METFYDLSAYDANYLFSSDYVHVENEKFLAYFLYRYAVNRKAEEVDLLAKEMRFSFLDLGN